MHRLGKVIINISKSFASPIFNFIIAIVGIQVLGKNDWGEFMQLLLWIFLVIFIANYGNKDFLLREYSKTPSKINELFSTNLSSRFILICLSFCFFFFFPIKVALLSALLVVLITIYQSLDSLIVYYQKFLTQLIGETLGFILIILLFLFSNQVTLTTIIIAYCCSFFVKICCIVPYLKIKSITPSFSRRHLILATPFFLIGFSGWLSSKLDLYIVTIFLPKNQLAEYQILMTAFLMLQSVSALIIYPFSKHLYRLPSKSIQKIKNKITMFSFPIVGFGSLGIYVVFTHIINIALPLIYFFLGFLLSLPIFFFIVDIILFYKKRKEKKVMYVNFVIALISLGISLILIPKFQITGALITVLINQYLLLFIYKTKIFI